MCCHTILVRLIAKKKILSEDYILILGKFMVYIIDVLSFS